MGNGKASSILYAREGARVILVYYNLKAAEETKEIIDSEGGEYTTFQADVTRAEDCRTLVEHCIEEYGRIDILHNNVSITKPRGVGCGFQRRRLG